MDRVSIRVGLLALIVAAAVGLVVVVKGAVQVALVWLLAVVIIGSIAAFLFTLRPNRQAGKRTKRSLGRRSDTGTRVPLGWAAIVDTPEPLAERPVFFHDGRGTWIPPGFDVIAIGEGTVTDDHDNLVARRVWYRGGGRGNTFL